MLVVGVVVIVVVLPVVMAVLLKTLVLLCTVLLLTALTNPSDLSFAHWISAQENVRCRENPSLKQWFSAVVKTIVATVCNEELSWTYYNVLFFSVVHVPALQRRAFGCGGMWFWADSYAQLDQFCRAKWIQSFAKGGVVCRLDQYQRSHNPKATTATTNVASDQALRTAAIQYKMKKDWKLATKSFLQASAADTLALSKTNMLLEAAWCALEDCKTRSDAKAKAWKLVDNAVALLVSKGYFDEAARALAELALRWKRKFAPQRPTDRAVVEEIAKLYLKAVKTSEAGDHVHRAIEYGLRAALVYAEASMWSAAESAFEAVAAHQASQEHWDMAHESCNHAMLCRIGRLDLEGAQQMIQKTSNTRLSELDVLLGGVLDAYDQWSITRLDAAISQYERARRLVPWQRQCLQCFRTKLCSSDLR